MDSGRLAIARDCYRAYATGERTLIEDRLAPGFTFFSPADPGIDRERYFGWDLPRGGEIR